MCTWKFQLQELQQLLEAYLQLGADVGPGSRLPDILLHGIAYRWAQGPPSGPSGTDPRPLLRCWRLGVTPTRPVTLAAPCWAWQ